MSTRNTHPGLPRQGIPPQAIGFDIDGVVADTMEAFIRIAREDYGYTVRPEDITRFEVEECLDMPRDAIAGIFERLLADPLGADLRPMAGAVETITAMSRSGPVTFITARPDTAPLSRWLAAHFGEETCRGFRLLSSGDHDNKAELIRACGLSFFVDDRARTCRMLAAEGITPIVFDQPWNRGRHRLPLVRHWGELRALCGV
jgi:uncharacterized HAD superfamily protein